MTQKNSSDIDPITEAINMHGIFFKQSIRQKIETIDNITVLGEEYPINYLEGSSLDLLFQVKTKNHTFVIPTECKRARTSTKQWIFFPDPSNYSKISYSLQKNACSAQHAEYFTNLGMSICIEGIELKKKDTKQKNTNFYKADSDPIWEAANQACKGLSAIVIEEIRQRNKNPEDTNMENIIIFPIVVTTAQLFVCDTDKNAIDILSGNYSKKLPLKEVGWTILSHPFTPSQGVGVQRLEITNTAYEDFYSRGRNTKDGIIFVNSACIQDFISLLDKYPQ